MDEQVWRRGHWTGESPSPLWAVVWYSAASGADTCCTQGFYNATADRFIEPKLTGSAYSFSADGHFESALFLAISNRTSTPTSPPTSPQGPANIRFSAATSPSCPSALLEFQHGTLTLTPANATANASLLLTPLAADGRRLRSDPCSYTSAVLTRYAEPVTISQYLVSTDAYNGKQRLELYAWDGTPMNPLWRSSAEPVMLSTGALGAGRKRTRRWVGRSVGGLEGDWRQGLGSGAAASWWLWAGLGLTGAGAALFLCS